MFAGNFAPVGWALCHGQVLAIVDNEVLFQLIGTTYGGDGQVTFALPDLRGRVPVHQGQGPGLQNYQLAQTDGNETVTLTQGQLPSHRHIMGVAAGVGHVAQPQGAMLAMDRDYRPFRGGSTTVAMAPALANTGGTQPHQNLPPYLCVNFIISLFGIFPSQT